MGNSTSKQTDTLYGSHISKSKSSSQRKSLSHIQFSAAENSSEGNEDADQNGGRQKPPMRLQRSASGADVTEKYLTQLVPIERLADYLKRQSNKNGAGTGITETVFAVRCIWLLILS